MRIAYLGLGRMGAELATHVIAAGHDVRLWNRTTARAERLAAAAGGGAVAVPGAEEAVDGAELVITTLFGPDTVREVVLAGDLPFAPGAVWVDVTTVAPGDAAEFGAWAAERGLGYVHSPVVGSLGPARERALGVLAGGAAGAVEKALPVVSLWADPDRLRTFDSPAKAAASKLVANLALATTMQAVAEALALGEGGGLSVDEVLEQLGDKTPLAVMTQLKGDLVRDGSFEPAQFSADALAKDAGLMLRTAVEPLPSVTAAYVALRAAQEAGRGDSDFSVIADRGRRDS